MKQRAPYQTFCVCVHGVEHVQNEHVDLVELRSFDLTLNVRQWHPAILRLLLDLRAEGTACDAHLMVTESRDLCLLGLSVCGLPQSEGT